MAKAKTSTVLMGSALLAAIASGAVARITQEQAGSLDASHFTVNTADIQDGAAAVTLTDAGKAAAASAPAPAPVSNSKIVIDDDVPMPASTRGRNSEASYPFDDLKAPEGGKFASFHVAKTAENPDPAVRLSSSVSGARVKYSPLLTNEDGSPKMETYEVNVFQKGPDGKDFKGPDGKRVVIGKETKTRQARGEPERDFKVVAVGADDPRGEGARCFRIK